MAQEGPQRLVTRGERLFHCRQAVEKALKAFLVWRDHPFRKTHDLVELTRQCVDLKPTPGDVLRGVGGLTHNLRSAIDSSVLSF